MKNDVYIKNAKKYNYDNSFYNPSRDYPEAIDIRIRSDKDIYRKMRDLFIEMQLDKNNINTIKWNPFADFIKENDVVLIKPNLVMHSNICNEGTTDSLITNFAIIRPIIDYTILALNGTGKIILGDAPVQECDFEKVIELNNLSEGIKEYNKKGYNIELIDFRKNSNLELKCNVVTLNNDSSLVEIDK